MNEEQKIRELESELGQLRKEFRAYVDIKQKEENQRMRTALLAAGGIILALAGFIWVEVIIPVIQAAKGR